MKSVYIHCPVLSAEAYTQVLQKLCPASVRNVTVYCYADKPTAKQLKTFVEAQRNFGLQRSVRFRNILVISKLTGFSGAMRRVLLKNSFTVALQAVPEQAEKLVRPIRRAVKKRIPLKLLVDAPNDQKSVYMSFAAQGLSIHLQKPIYDQNTAQWFAQWLYDPAAQGVNTFTDIITMLTMDTYSPNCRYASCFGTTFRVDAQLQVYLCPYHMDAHTCLGQLTEVEQLLQCENVVQLLGKTLEKRGNCAKNCRGFSVCQGGCPLECRSDNECIHYVETVDQIRDSLLDVYHNRKLDRVNSVVKNAILNALAFGTAFFK